MAQRALPPDLSLSLIEFARACRAAARAVSLYPAGHRAVDEAVSRLTEVARRAAGDTGLAIDIMPSGLRAGGLPPDRDDAAVRELASLLHAHQIGGITLHANADRESWQTLLGLVGRNAEDNRRDGGLALLWKTAGGPSIELHAIDYAALLREGHGGSLSRLIKAANDGALAAISIDDLEAIIAAVEDRGSARPIDDDRDEAAGRAIARLGALVLERAGQVDESRVEAALQRLAQLTQQLSAEGMCGLVAARAAADGDAGGTSGPGGGDARGAEAVIDHLDAEGTARFVATALATEGSATARLREAFEALVPADDRRRIASLAEEMLPAAGAPPAEMPRLRQELDHLVVSYDDSRFVGSAYARELTSARGRAEDLETAKPDPPERLDSWLSTVSDGALRGLDLQVLTDLLGIDQDPEQFAVIAQQAATRLEELVRVGFIEPALDLEAALETAREAGGARGESAEAALARLRSGTIVRDLMPLVRRAAPEDIDRITALLVRLGPAIAPALASALAREADPAARERLRSVLAGFGDAGEQAVRALLASDNPETRRNAAGLLRDFGGAAGIDVLERLLGDSDLRVRREALRALAVVEDPQAHERILRTLETVPGDTQRALLDELGLVRDARVSPLLALLARRWRERRMSEAAIRAVSQIGMLGASVTRDAVDALAALLDASQWWSPRRARTVRARAADALAAVGTPDARAALEAAVARGGKGAGAARRALARRQT